MPVNVLKSKLHMPQLPDTIRRTRFDSLLSEISRKKLTVVTAGAGFGKTTLISQVCRDKKLPTLWYRLDHTDLDLKTFLVYLIKGLSEKFPGLGRETIMRMESSKVLFREIEAVLPIFLSEIEKHITDDFFFVLDDYHLVQENAEINEVLFFLIERFSQNIHLILISRIESAIPLSRFRAMRDVVDISEDDLSFTVSEIETLYKNLFDASLEEKSLQNLYQKTGGWISGLILFYHSLKGKTTSEIEKKLSAMSGPQKNVLTYLEENVYGGLSCDLQTFLVHTSILTHLDVAFCNRLLNIENANDILEKLESSHLFTIPDDMQKQCYHYHHLFKEFLESKLQRIKDSEEIKSLHGTAAELYEKCDDIEEAINHYLSAGKMDDVCRLLGLIGRKLLWNGRLNLINTYLSKIPDSYIRNEPWIQYMQAQSLDLCGKSNQAISVYQKALVRFRKNENRQGEVLCLMELGRNYFETGDLQQAEDRFRELLKQENLEQQNRLEIFGQLVFISSCLGKMEESDSYYDQAEKILPADDTIKKIYQAVLHLYKSFRYNFSGDSRKALEIGEKARNIFEEMEIFQLVALYYQMASNSYWFIGDFSKGLEAGQIGLKIIEEKGFQETYGWFLLLLATNSSGLGRLEESLSYGKKCLECFREVSNKQGEAAADMAIAETLSYSDNYQQAYEYIYSGMSVVGDLNLPMIKGELKGRLAQLLIRDRRFEEALSSIENAGKIVVGFKWYECWITIIHARCFFETGDIESAIEKMSHALDISRANSYDFWLCKERDWICPLLEEMIKRKILGGYALKIREQISQGITEEPQSISPAGLYAAINESDEKHHTKELTVLMFGKFDVYIGNRKLEDSKWKSRKAKMLFKYLLYHRNKGFINKDVLMELLWPDEDPALTTNRFHVAMNSLRKTLEPDKQKGASFSFIQNNGDSYMIKKNEKDFIDTEKFIENIKLAENEDAPDKRLSYLLDADALYSGDFLKEDPYEKWCKDERLHLEKKYLGVLSKIVKLYEEKKDFLKCISYADKCLEIDKYDESIYRLLMTYYFFNGNNSMVKRTFELCKSNIEIELDCPLSDDIQMLYEEMMWDKVNSV